MEAAQVVQLTRTNGHGLYTTTPHTRVDCRELKTLASKRDTVNASTIVSQASHRIANDNTASKHGMQLEGVNSS